MFKTVTTKPTVRVFEKCIPQVVISADAISKMEIYVAECNEEVGWLGTAQKIKNVIFITDVYLFKQEVHATTTEITPEGLGEFAEELLKQEDGMEIWNNLKVWGHSHVNMSPTPSGQDDKQMEVFAESGQDWFIRIICNKAGTVRLDIFDYSIGVTYVDVPWIEGLSTDEQAVQKQIYELQKMLDAMKTYRIEKYNKDIKAEIKEKVKKKSFQYSQVTTKGQYTMGNNGEIIIHGDTTTNTKEDKKNTEGKEDGKEEETKSNYKNISVIETDKDVYRWLDWTCLIEIGEAETQKEVESILVTYGFEEFFSDNDVKKIWDIAKEAVERMYFGSH